MQSERGAWCTRWLSAIRDMAGMPDYEAFLADQRERHPDQPVPSAREYFAQWVAARYGDGPTRCC